MFEKYLGGAGGLIPNTIQKRLGHLTLYVIGLLVIAFILTPLYLMVVVALQDPSSLYSGGSISYFPSSLSLSNFRVLIAETDMVSYLVNSIIITAGCMLITTVLAVVSGYTLTRFKIRGRSMFARLILFTYMTSPIVLAIPLYTIFYRLGVLNSYVTAILALTSISAPFSIWLMWLYFQKIPIAYEESAWTRGASRMRTVRDVVLPLARPGYVTVSIFTFAVAWNDYTMVRVILSEQSLYPLTIGATLIQQQTFIGWSHNMALMVVMSIPPFLVAALLQNYLLQGFNLDAS